VNGIVDLFGRILLGFLNKVDTGFTRANVKKSMMNSKGLIVGSLLSSLT